MKMIEEIIRSMQDTGLIDGMSLQDCDTLATAALEGMKEPTRDMVFEGEANTGCAQEDVRYIYRAMIDAALDE